ncbi:uncharacterized protein LOC134785688 [Penaeus indicus]|uniref:uncharacterized protein LOC134784261 n=1 Tax=Penaeus indicus TaxID=29960 RepID=UPI00300C9367
MPKIQAHKLKRKLLDEFKDFEDVDGVIQCKFCHVKMDRLKKSDFVQHSKTKKHRNNVQSINEEIPNMNDGDREDIGIEQEMGTSPQKQFNEKLCRALLSADIPLNKLSSVEFRNFLEEISGKDMPDQSTLRKYYVQNVYKSKISKLRKKVAGKKLWVSIDETTDVEQRFVACFVLGILGEEDERDKCYLGNMALLDAVNHSTIAAFFNESLLQLWPDQILYHNILVVTTDAAPYMLKAMRGLNVLYPKMIHITCIAHGLHRVAEIIRYNYSEVNRLISAAKTVFVKAPLRVQKFRDSYPEVPLPPLPVITRWGTWLQAAVYHSTHLEKVSEVVLSFNANDAQCIAESQELVNNVELKYSLSFISSNFSIIPSTIEKLETRGLDLKTAINLMEQVETNLKKMYDQQYYKKLQAVMKKNKGFLVMKEINSLLSGKLKEAESEYVKQLSSSDISAFRYAPLVSCDAERVFSAYKNVLADNRRRFLFDNLKQTMIIKCNNF